MAEIALRQAKTPFVEDLAGEVLGVPDHMMGMDTDITELEKALPFDRACGGAGSPGAPRHHRDVSR